MESNNSSLKIGSVLQNGKYRILSVFGQGGFGITYEAEQVLLHRTVAVKEFFMKNCCERDVATSQVSVGTGTQRNLAEKFRSKFIREAQMIAGMSHPNIVRVLDVFEENDTAYYVMENLTGGSISSLIKKEGFLREQLAEKYVRQIASALSYIHSKNTVHLDIKPSNILLNSEGDAVLVDFGISKHYDDAGEQTSSTPVGISKGYSPVEQYKDGAVTQFKPSVDIYALGATMYNMLSGVVPPEATAVFNEGLPRPEGISDRMWKVISNSMQPRISDRPQNMTDFLELFDNSSVSSPQTNLPSDNEEETIINESLDQITKPAVQKTAPNVQKIKPNQKRSWRIILAIAFIFAVVLLLFKLLSGRGNASNNITSGYDNGHEWVDLGLSVKWATVNLGADSPSDYGNYYAWGETSTKATYDWSAYKWCNGSENSLTKYNTKSDYGSVDNRTRLSLSDDAARANWGGNWRMPTEEEFYELRSKCTWKWTTEWGVNGYKVTGKNGNSIFLPAAGYRDGTDLYYGGSDGFYWSSALNTGYPDGAWNLPFDSSYFDTVSGSRDNGLSVRPVTE